jgi:DNA-binding beta-propeller fold protein YncE
MDAWMKEKGAAPASTLLDRDSKVGKLYGATNTPHMYVIDPKGTLVYVGAIDDKRSTNPADVKTAKNYVRAALEESIAGKPVSQASTSAYGCTVKY